MDFVLLIERPLTGHVGSEGFDVSFPLGKGTYTVISRISGAFANGCLNKDNAFR